MFPEDMDVYPIRFIEHHGNMVYSFRTMKYETHDECWIANGVKFDHEPTKEEADKAYTATPCDYRAKPAR